MNKSSDIRRCSAADEDDLIRAYQAGEALGEIQERFRLTAKGLRLILRKNDVPKRVLPREKRSKRYFSTSEVDEIVAAYLSGASVSEIRDRFSIALSQLYRCLGERGIIKRNQNILAGFVGGEDEPPIVGLSATTGTSSFQGDPRKTSRQVQSRQDLGGPEGEMIRTHLTRLYANPQLSVAEIASELRISQSSMTRLVRALKLPPRGKGGGRRAIPPDIIARLPEYLRRYEAGESLKSLAAEAGIGLSTLEQKIRTMRTQK